MRQYAPFGGVAGRALLRPTIDAMNGDDMTATESSTDEAPTKRGEALRAAKIIAIVLVLLAGWAGSVVLWGVPGLYIPALVTVPVIWGVLLLFVRGG
jgi:hypothetical protein